MMEIRPTGKGRPDEGKGSIEMLRKIAREKIEKGSRKKKYKMEQREKMRR